MQDFRNLKVWQKAHAFVLDVYAATVDFPQHEMFGVRSQLRREAYFIPSKLAEGAGRETDAEFAKCLYVAQGAASAVEYLLILCRDLGYFGDVKHAQLSDSLVEVRKMMTGFSKTLKA